MSDNQKIARAARKRAAQRRARLRFASAGAGVLVMLIVGIIVFLNIRGGDPVVSASLMNTLAPTATAEATIGLNDTPAPTLTITPTLTLEPTSEPVSEPDPTTTPGPDFSVTLNVKDKVTIRVGETGQLRAKLNPSDPSASLVWKSSDEKVVKVNQKGAVKGVGAGVAQISLYVNNSVEVSASVNIKVEKKDTYVWIPKTGKKYHSTSSCSGMKNPRKVTLSYAKSHGYTKCSKCW